MRQLSQGGALAGSCGVLLRSYRALANLTQEELAERSGLSVHAISMLERGVRQAPRPRTIDALAAAMRLGEAQRVALLLARDRGHTAATPDGSVVGAPQGLAGGIPPAPVADFVGRENEMAALDELLDGGRDVAIVGMAGAGKTQLAAGYVARRRQRYPHGVFWLRAGCEATLVDDLASLASRLDLPEQTSPRHHRVEAVLRRLRSRPRWLLVLENVDLDTPDVLGRWLPGLSGHMLATSRGPLWPRRLLLGMLAADDAVRLLLGRTGSGELAAAEIIVAAMGRLPLALAQAAAYATQTGRDLSSYADLLPARLLDLLDGVPAEDYPVTLGITLRRSYERLACESVPAAALLRLCADGPSEGVPTRVLRAAAHRLPDRLGAELGDDLGFDQAVAALLRHGLIERQGTTLTIHPLVAAMVCAGGGTTPVYEPWRSDVAGLAFRPTVY